MNIATHLEEFIMSFLSVDDLIRTWFRVSQRARRWEHDFKFWQRRLQDPYHFMNFQELQHPWLSLVQRFYMSTNENKKSRALCCKLMKRAEEGDDPDNLMYFARIAKQNLIDDEHYNILKPHAQAGRIRIVQYLLEHRQEREFEKADQLAQRIAITNAVKAKQWPLVWTLLSTLRSDSHFNLEFKELCKDAPNMAETAYNKFKYRLVRIHDEDDTPFGKKLMIKLMTEMKLADRFLADWNEFRQQHRRFPTELQRYRADHDSVLDRNTCAICDKHCSLKCSGCRIVWYCSKEHQKQHWPRHKLDCRFVTKKKKKQSKK